jgi:hypothetical protein
MVAFALIEPQISPGSEPRASQPHTVAASETTSSSISEFEINFRRFAAIAV